MMGIIIQEEVWNTIEAYGHEMAKNELFFNKKSQTHDFFNTFCQLWLLCCIAMMECLQKNSSVTSVETKVFGYDFLLLHG